MGPSLHRQELEYVLQVWGHPLHVSSCTACACTVAGHTAAEDSWSQAVGQRERAAPRALEWGLK